MSILLRAKAIEAVSRAAQNPLFVFGAEERNQFLYDHVFEKIRPDQPLPAETIVQPTQERPHVAERRPLGLRWVMQRRSHVNVAQASQVEQGTKPGAIRSRDIDHCHMVD